MEKLSAKKKLTVVKLYLSGLSYNEISVKTGISKGAISGIIADLKGGGFPEFADLADQVDVLRELSLNLKHSSQTPVQCAVGLAALNRIHECGLEVADINRWSEIIKMAGGDDTAKAFIDMVYRIQDAQKETGLTIDEIDNKFQELQNKLAELQPTLTELDEKKDEITELEKRRDDLAPVVNSLEQKYSTLNPIVKDLQERQGNLLQQIKKEEDITASTQAGQAAWAKVKQELLKAGFTIEALVEFNDKVRVIATHHHIPVSALRERLLHELEVLDKGLGLETLVEDKQTELKKEEEVLTSVKNEIEEHKGTIGVLEEQQAALEAGITVTRDKISQEIAKIVPVAKDMLKTFNGELQRGGDEILGTMQHVKDQTFDIGKEVGRYEGIVEANHWLVDLFALMKGDESLNPTQVRAILLPVIRGAQPWMKRNQEKTGMNSSISQTLALLVGGLEQWQV
jgi:predicted  nucleic acid-binding Zn-ribbon protein